MKYLFLCIILLTGCGNPGTLGVHGENGAMGIQGELGNTGERGFQGVSGQNGKSCTIVQETDGVIILCPDGSSGYLKNGTKGDRGIPGSQGPKGEQGLKGNTGPQGAKGDTGKTRNVIYKLIVKDKNYDHH